MKLLVVAATCLPAAVAVAQPAGVKPQKPKLPQSAVRMERKREGIFYSPVADLRYSTGYVLARPAGLYRSLADARRGRPAHWLRAGAKVFVVAEHPR